MTMRSYLDWNATAPLRREARDAMLVAFDEVGNPSSVHAEGRDARQLLAKARRQVAALVGADPQNVTFTSGGTEANVMALAPGIGKADARGNVAACSRLVVSGIEHASVAAGGRFGPHGMETIGVRSSGEVDIADLERHLSADRARALVSVMLANNETGVIQPVTDVADRVHVAGGLLHVDAVQAAGRIAVDINLLGADLLTVSGHKLGAPAGIGALILRDDTIQLPEPLLRGGGQELARRAGTENILGAVAFGAVAEAAADNLETEQQHMSGLRNRLEAGLRAISPRTVIFGEHAPRVPNTVLFTVPGIRAEVALIALDLNGVAVSSGAACSSGKVTPSQVLAAMGVPADLARGAIRASVGHSTTERDIDRLLQAWRTLVEALPEHRREIAA